MNTNKIAVSFILSSAFCSEKSGDGSMILRNRGALPQAPAEPRLPGAFSLPTRGWSQLHRPLGKHTQSSSTGTHTRTRNPAWLTKFILRRTVRIWTAYQRDEASALIFLWRGENPRWGVITTNLPPFFLLQMTRSYPVPLECTEHCAVPEKWEHLGRNTRHCHMANTGSGFPLSYFTKGLNTWVLM